MIFAILLAAAAAETPSLTLETAIELALEHNADQRRQELQVLSSRQDAVLARAAILPRVDFNASAGLGAGNRVVNEVLVSQPAGLGAATSANIGVRQLLWNGGGWQAGVEVAKLSVASGEAAVAEQRLQTAYVVEVGFFELVRAQRQLEVFEETAARSRDQVRVAEKLFEAGRATQADVYAARANRDNDEVNRLGQEARVTLARQDLALAIGLVGALPSVVEPPGLLSPPKAPPSFEEAEKQALAQRPSLKALGLVAEAQRTRIEGAGADNWPSVYVAGSYGRNDTVTDPVSSSNTLSANVGLSWNLFSGFSTRAQVDKAQVAVLQAENDLEAAKRVVAADVQKALARVGTALAQLKIAADAEENAREALRLAKVKQDVGTGTQLEVRDGELRLTQAQLARLGALVDGHEAEAALRRAMGAGRE